MDINSAELQVNRLLTYVKELADSSHKMYGKSKTRLRDVATTCSEVVRIISVILEEQSLASPEESEFTQPVNSDITDLLNGMQSELNRLKAFVAAPSATPASPNNVSAVSRKQAINDYNSVLSSLSCASIDIPIARNCAQILSRWFDVRFVQRSQNANFHYNIRRLSEWLRDIVIVYGYNVSIGNEDRFIAMFDEWCMNVQSDQDNTYAVPYFIYLFNRDQDPQQITLTAVVLWDILLDNGLSRLCTNTIDLYPSEDSVYRLCGQFNPSILDAYVDYKTNPAILTRCNLIKE